MLLKDKVVVITGVGPGLGRELSLGASERGATVLCVARTESYVEQVTQEIEDMGGTALAVPADVTSRADCLRIADTAEQRFGRLDGIVNSAFAAGAIGVFPDVDVDGWRPAFEVNFFGPLQLVQCCAPLLERDGGGAVVNVNSTNSIRPMKGQGGYGASKAALEYATRQLAVDLGDRPIRCNTVYCGPMRGPSLEAGMQHMADRSGVSFGEIEQGFTAALTQGRIPEDGDVAPVILFLLSDEASVVTGASIEATGGAWVEHRLGA